jgi:hypothetical protein
MLPLRPVDVVKQVPALSKRATGWRFDDNGSADWRAALTRNLCHGHHGDVSM